MKERESRYGSLYRIVRYDEPAPCVTGTRFGSGAIAVADNRLNSRKQRYPGTYRVENWVEASNTILGQTDIQCGAPSINDPRLGCSPRSGSYGVQDWNKPSTKVTGSGDVHSGNTAVADPRIPGYNERCVMVIIAEDGTWHRPLTTYELAALQGFPSHLLDGRPFQIDGCSDAKAREYVGNAVPPDAAEGMANVILMAMAMAMAAEGVTLEFSMKEHRRVYPSCSTSSNKFSILNPSALDIEKSIFASCLSFLSNRLIEP